MSQLVVGNTLGRYELLLPIAQGGMAQVWAARLRGTRGFQKLVAVKTILPGAIDNTRLEQMFLEEAQLASQIHHPNVVETLELGEHEGTLYLVMEWVDGEPIGHLLTQAHEHGGLPLPIAVNLIGQVCQGLHAAHGLCDDSGNLLDVVHRDVSPQNVLVTLSGVAKLVDFGIAKATGRASNMTHEGEIKGKFAYMAPEQVQGHAVDRRSDIFALGILAYLLTTGKHPFRGENPAATVRSIMSDKPPTAPSAMNPDYPPALEGVIMKAIEKSRERRFASAHEMLSALDVALPEALDPSFSSQVAAFQQKVLGARAAERRAAIRRAQQLADRHRAEGTSKSSGTLRAISLDSVPDSVLPGLPERSASGSESGASNPFAAPPSSLRRGVLPVALAGAALAAFMVYLSVKSPAPGSSAPSAAAALPGAPAAAALPTATPPPAVAALPAASSAPSPVEQAEDKAPSKEGKGMRSHGRLPSKTGFAPVVAPVAAAPTPVPLAAPKATASTNAWDRDAFGGRH
jgi:serine/threonine protein kinase